MKQPDLSDILMSAVHGAACATIASKLSPGFPMPEKVHFNPPYTTVLWPDGDKTVVKCENGIFSEEFGLAMAYVRKAYGSRNKFKAEVAKAHNAYVCGERNKQKKLVKKMTKRIAREASESDGSCSTSEVVQDGKPDINEFGPSAMNDVCSEGNEV